MRGFKLYVGNILCNVLNNGANCLVQAMHIPLRNRVALAWWRDPLNVNGQAAAALVSRTRRCYAGQSVFQLIQLTGSVLARCYSVSLKRERSRFTAWKRRTTLPDGELTSDGGIQPIEVDERKRYRAEVHHDLVHVVGTATRHENAGVTAPDVTTAGIIHDEVNGDVQHTFDRPLDAHVQQLSMLRLLNLSGENVVRLAHLLQEHRVVPDRRS